MPWPQITPVTLEIYAQRNFQRTLHLNCWRSGRRDRLTAALNKGWADQKKVELGACRGRRVTRSTNFEMLWWGRMWHMTLWKTNVMMVMSQMHVLVHSVHAHIIPPWREDKFKRTSLTHTVDQYPLLQVDFMWTLILFNSWFSQPHKKPKPHICEVFTSLAQKAGSFSARWALGAWKWVLRRSL